MIQKCTLEEIEKIKEKGYIITTEECLKDPCAIDEKGISSELDPLLSCPDWDDYPYFYQQPFDIDPIIKHQESHKYIIMKKITEHSDDLASCIRTLDKKHIEMFDDDMKENLFKIFYELKNYEIEENEAELIKLLKRYQEIYKDKFHIKKIFMNEISLILYELMDEDYDDEMINTERSEL
jgi:hypothetical protein